MFQNIYNNSANLNGNIRNSSASRIIPFHNTDVTSKSYVDSKVKERALKLTNTLVANVNTLTSTAYNGLNTTPDLDTFGTDLTISTSSITFNITGNFLCTFNFYLTSAVVRPNVLFRFAINGVEQIGRSAHNYIRGSAGHQEASSCLTELLYIRSGDVLTITHLRVAAAGIVESPASTGLVQVIEL